MIIRHHLLMLSFIILGAACCSLCPAAELHRHTDWPAAQTAARQSNKIILAYIYQNGHDACTAMESNTFSQDAVAQALGGYELLVLNGDSQQNRGFCDHYRVGTRWNPEQEKQEGKTAFAAIPAYLFLDYNGREYYRTYGFHAPDVLLQLLGQVARLIEYQFALAQRPEDGRVHADLGRLYLELERSDLAQPLLEAAVKLDANNAAGARADAELDLILLSIPDDPMLAARSLIAYQFNRPETKRIFEVRYYLAVAYLAAGKEDQAEKILLDFAAIPPFLPDNHKLEGVHHAYLVQKGDQQVGFYDTDDLNEVKRRVQGAGHDPVKCRFIRKPVNPDYRNPWTEKADLLLRQLREEQVARKQPPK